ncbi:MAG: multidrug efflux SMR transporter [Bacteroidetes bacterium]|jgi:quaternary ammonium compound-resistance protein SugE|nr:multidrug efflux SMR transporter [Bacteroidota bacterium]
MAWIYLIIAGIFEVIWAVALRNSEGFTKLQPAIITILAMAVSIYLLAISLKTIPLGIAYTVWTGVGAIGAVIAGIILFNESKEILKLLFIFLIIAGIVGLKIVTTNK